MVSRATESRRAAAERGEKQDPNRARKMRKLGIELPKRIRKSNTETTRVQHTKQIESQGSPRLYPLSPSKCKHTFVQPVDPVHVGCIQCKTTFPYPSDLQESA